MISFSEDDIRAIRDMVARYDKVSAEIDSYKSQAEELRVKTIEAEARFNALKSEEKVLMDELHRKYGDFGLNDIMEIFK